MSNAQIPDYRRFTVAVKLNGEELAALKRLQAAERLPAAQIVRRLIWQAAPQTADKTAGGGVRP